MDEDEKRVADEISEMLETLDGEHLEIVSTDAPSTDAPGTDVPGTDVPSTDAPSTDAPSTDAPTTDVPTDEYAELKAEIEELKGKLNAPPKKEEPAPAPATEAPIETENFIGDIDVDELTRDGNTLNQVFNKIYQSAVKAARNEVKQSSENTLRSIPDIVRNNIEITTSLKKASEDFYDKNEDLKPFKRVVATVFEEITAKDPHKSYKDILDDVGPEVRKRLDLHNKAPKKDTKPPRLPKKRSTSKSEPNVDPNPLLDELDAMDNSLNS